VPACGQGGAGDQSIVARQFINNFISLSHKEPNSACQRNVLEDASRVVAISSRTMANHSKERTQAEAQLKKTQKAQRVTEGSQAMSEYVAAGHAVRAKTARLRELRLVLSENFIRRRFAS